MNNKKARLTITVVCILTLSIVIIIISMSVYNYYSMDVIKPSKPPLDSLDDEVETTKVAMIYQTKTGGDEWFMDPSKLNEDKRFDANANLSRNEDGTWSVDSNQQSRLNIWTNGSGDFRQKGGMDTYNHSIIKTRGYWYEPSDWKNVEMTGYFKLNEYVDDEFSTYSRSIWHNRTNNGCGGSDYKLNLHFDGSVTLNKEEWHVHYSDQPKPAWMPEHKIIDGLGNLTNKWIGLKNVVYNIEQNSTSYPRMEMWVDQNNNNTWKKIHEYLDRGDWGSTMNRCGGEPDQLITWGSPVATFRWDDTANVHFRNLSVREIQPP
jgi:hypothetical protein